MLASRYYKVHLPVKNPRPVATTGASGQTRDGLAMPRDDDFSLIQRVVAKDRQAFEKLYRRYYQRLFGYLHKLLKHKELVEETVNDVMLVVWKDAARFSHKSRLSTWIFGIAYHKALKALEKTAEKPLDRAPSSQAWDERDNPEAAIFQQEASNALVQAVQALSPEHRAVVELTFYSGFAYHEIAAIVGCPVNTVKTRMFYARKRLGELLSGSAHERLEERQ
jgi:RNA polymerase sigma factor (sigma-70 family)